MADYYTNYTSTQALRGHDEALSLHLASGNFRYNIESHISPEKTARIVDVACGNGRYLKAIADRGYTKATGIDISREQIIYAQDCLGLKNVEQGDGLAFLQKHPDSCDVVLLLDILEHLNNEEVLEWLVRCREALKPGGVLVIQVPNAVTPVSVLFHGDFTHQRAYSPSSMSQALRLAGWTDFHHYSAYDSPYRTSGLMRMTLWKFMLNPLLSFLMKILYGTTTGGIFTPNLLTIVRKGR